MAESHPYISGVGNVVQIVSHLRNTFPATISADTLKKLGIAPNNESYLLNILRFCGIIDADGKKTSAAQKVFTLGQDEKFSSEFGRLVKAAYKDLFDVHGDQAWALDKTALTTFFRQSDDTSATIGGRQASTFMALAGLSGHGDVPTPKSKGAAASKPKTAKKQPKKKSQRGGTTQVQIPSAGNAAEASARDIGLTVRIEINLPADGEQKTYDRIFESIRKNLIDG